MPELQAVMGRELIQRAWHRTAIFMSLVFLLSLVYHKSLCRWMCTIGALMALRQYIITNVTDRKSVV